ncbi:MAG: TIR domain-containing protein [Desulfobulbaceae bacterium]|nr:TIR domain-containing protein [Desulfobulbaceae bacterium]
MVTVNIAPLPDAEKLQDHIFSSPILHPGLLFERFFPCWQTKEDGDVSRNNPLEKHLKGFCRLYGLLADREIYPALLGEMHTRLDRLVKIREGRTIRAITTGPLALGLGNDHPTENGFCFDRNSGVVFLPGSGIKGLCRAWSRVSGQEATFNELFGYIKDKEGAMGRVIVLPAYPLTWPRLVADVICNHHFDYYNKNPKQRRYCRDGYPVPLDVESPVPIHHLAVQEGCEFVFRLLPAGPESRQEKGDLKQMVDLLAEGLEWLGIGARTAAGYGTMAVREEDRSKLPSPPIGGSIMPRIIKTFVSYTHDDGDKVRAFLDQGAMAGVFPWLDHNELLPMAGDSLPESLKRSVQDPALKTVTLFLSRNSRNAPWVEKEMGWARDMKKRVIPVLLDNEEATKARLNKWLAPEDPLYLKADDDSAPSSWISTMLHEAGVDRAQDVVLYLGHREGAAAPMVLPQEWREQYPVLILGNGEYWQDRKQEIEARSWLPEDNEAYRRFEKSFGMLKNMLSGVENIYISGMAPLGIGGLIGKVWDRGTRRRLTTWNSYEKKEWTVTGDPPGTGDPDSWQYVHYSREEEEKIGQGENILLGHFSRKDQFLDGCSWLREHGGELAINRAIMLNFPQAITADAAPGLARECAQSFAWAKSTYQPGTIYWMTGLPLALMPLVTHLSRATARIIFLDYDLKHRRYIEAFTLQ